LGGDRAGGFPGAARILDELSHGTNRLRVGIRPDGRAPMREAVPLFSGENAIGVITSGGFGPSIGAPIAMGYVVREHAQIGAIIQGDLRGKMLLARIVSLPFQPTTFKR
jgi:aminomethyltransferase